MYRARGIRWHSPVEELGRIVQHVREEAIRVEDTYVRNRKSVPRQFDQLMNIPTWAPGKVGASNCKSALDKALPALTISVMKTLHSVEFRSAVQYRLGYESAP